MVFLFSSLGGRDLLRVSKRGHLPTALGPTLPSPRRGDRQDRGGGGGEWSCGSVGSGSMQHREADREGRGRQSGLVDRHTHSGRRSGRYGDSPIAREITADWVDDARRRLL